MTKTIFKLFVISFVAGIFSLQSYAAPQKRRVVKSAQKKVVKSPTVSSYRREPYQGAIVVDAKDGKILFADRIKEKGYPASVTKLMTLLLVLEDVKEGKYSLEDKATASYFAASQEPSAIGIRAGQSMTVDDLLHSIMVKSANDGAVVLAEHSAWRRRGGTGAPSKEIFNSGELFEAFIARMNRKAQELGMTNTRYVSPNGLPPPRGSKRGFDCSTAEDLSKLAMELVKNPQVIKYTRQAKCNVTDGFGKEITFYNHNNILWKKPYKVDEADGLKTGYNNAGGSSIIVTGERNGHRVIVVVLGSNQRNVRDEVTANLLRDALGAVSGW